MHSNISSPASCGLCKGTAKARVLVPKFIGRERGHNQCTKCLMTFDSDVDELLDEKHSRLQIDEIGSREDFMRLFVETWDIANGDPEDVYPRFGWEDNSALKEGVASHILRAIEKHCVITSSPELLDVGCGTGFTTLELSKKFGAESILGIDPSPTVKTLTERHGVPAVQGTLDTVNLPSASRDVVVIVGNFMLHRDPGFTLSESFRILRDGGLLVVDYKNTKSMARVIAGMLSRFFPKKLGNHPVVQRNFVNMRYGMSRVHMDRFLAGAGFKTIEDYSKPPRLLEFGNTSDHQVGVKGLVWRSLDLIDSVTDNRAWIQVAARKGDGAKNA